MGTRLLTQIFLTQICLNDEIWKISEHSIFSLIEQKSLIN